MLKQTTPYSLEKYIRYRLILVLIPALLVGAFVIHKSVHLLIDHLVVDRLEQDADSLVSAMEKTEQGWVIDKRFLPHVYQRASSGHYYILKWDGGRIRSRSLWDKQVEPQDFSQGDTNYLYYRIGNEFWVIHMRQITKAGEVLTLWVAEDISAIDAKQKSYEIRYWLAFIFCGALFILWQRWVLNYAFNKLDPIQESIRGNRVAGELVFPEDVPSEIKPLVDSIKVLVDRSVTQTSRLRMSVGNLAHELKRPLQALNIIAEEMKDTPYGKRLDDLCLSLQHRIDIELKRARIAGSPMPMANFRFQEELPHLSKLLDRIHDCSIQLVLDTPQDELPFDRDDMLELLGNLLENSWKYARQKVSLRVRHQGKQYYLIIEDDGLGVSQNDLVRINARGVRVDESTDKPGSGLGLSICQSIAESYGGSLSFDQSPLGGLRVSILLVAG